MGSRIHKRLAEHRIRQYAERTRKHREHMASIAVDCTCTHCDCCAAREAMRREKK